MPKMIEMIQHLAVPANVVRTAARGALALPPDEMLEILVHLVSQPLFAEQARMTLSSWDQASAMQVCADPNAPPSVLAYFLDARNWRPALLQVLFENPSVTEHQLMIVAEAATREVAQLMAVSPRVLTLKWVVKQLCANHRFIGSAEYTRLEAQLSSTPTIAATHAVVEHPPVEPTVDEDQIIDQIHRDHAEELKADAHKKFELVKADSDELDELAELVQAVEAKPDSPVEVVAAAVKKEPERLSTIQKITRMSVGERVQLAVKGSKDERFVLIRDGSKVVAIAVLESPKLSDSEMEMFAGMKNIQQSVLRAIATKRKFIKQYAVMRALCSNPRCPVDVTLKLLPNLLMSDLNNLSKNKNVSDTLRKIALKMYKDKATTRKGG